MDERTIQGIMRLLQLENTQERVQHLMQTGRLELTVTIGRAAKLFGFTENQLRDWEERGLLKPLRSKHATGQRQYPLPELDKLAIIRAVLDEGYPPGAIPLNIDELWNSLHHTPVTQSMLEGQKLPNLDQRVAQSNQDLFWRYFASQALRYALMSIREGMPAGTTALILPLHADAASLHQVQQPEHLPEVGESLVGWLSRNGSFYTFLETAPTFEYPSDFRIQPLQAVEEQLFLEQTLIVLPRQAPPLNLNPIAVETTRRLLAPLYENKHIWASLFGPGMRDWHYPATTIASNHDASDEILNGLADMVVQLGGETETGSDRWRFCCLLMGSDPSLSLPQQSLIVEAQSQHSPYRANATRFVPDERLIIFRASQGSHIVYRRELSTRDINGSSQDLEATTRSAIAIPLLNENGSTIAVLYVAAEERDAFSESDRRLLRLIGKLIEEHLVTSHLHLSSSDNLATLLHEPDNVEPAFNNFLTENDFVYDIESLLRSIQSSDAYPWPQPPSAEPLTRRTISVISVAIDQQSLITRKYGERTLKNLSQLIGQRIQKRLVGCQLYHIYAGRFYALLKDIPLDKTREVAENLRDLLHHSYHVDTMHASSEQPTHSETTIELSDVTVRLGVTLYYYEKLSELLTRYAHSHAPTSEVRSLIVGDLDQALDLGQEEGGNIVIGWDHHVEDRGPHVRRFVPFLPSKKAT